MSLPALPRKHQSLPPNPSGAESLGRSPPYPLTSMRKR